MVCRQDRIGLLNRYLDTLCNYIAGLVVMIMFEF